MREWRIDYAFRCNGGYEENRLYVKAEYIDEAIGRAVWTLNNRMKECEWDSYLIWNAGIIADADEEVI